MKPTQKYILTRVICLSIAAAACVFDQYTKFAMRHWLDTKPGREVQLIPNFLSLVYRQNTGGAFSMYDSTPSLFLYLPVILIVVLVVALFWDVRGNKFATSGAVALSFMLGGAIGNLIDRFRFGRVFDFIDFYFRTYHWPSFNAADSFIVIGVFLFALTYVFSERDNDKKHKEQN